MQDIEEILEIFKTYEETNKKLYDQVNTLSNEVTNTYSQFTLLRKTNLRKALSQ
jgi:hypothetical protein